VRDTAAALLADLHILDNAATRSVLLSITASAVRAGSASVSALESHIGSAEAAEAPASLRWRAVTHNPHIVAAVSGSADTGSGRGGRGPGGSRGSGAPALRVVPRAEDLRRQYQRDKALQAAVTALMSDEHTKQLAAIKGRAEDVRDGAWAKRLEQWAVV
jgi:hypothetical protein